MALLGTGVLAIWNDVDPAAEREYNDWYLRDHFPDRLSVPGFRRGRRYEALAAAPKYFTFYETDTVEVLASPAYVARLDEPTPWTARIMPSFRNMSRTPCRVVASDGAGEGGAALTIRLAPRAGDRERLRAILCERLIPQLAAEPGIVGLHLWQAAAVGPSGTTREVELRGRADAAIDLALVVEATRAEELAALHTGALSAAALAALGAPPQPAIGLYRLLYGLTAVKSS